MKFMIMKLCVRTKKKVKTVAARQGRGGREYYLPSGNSASAPVARNSRVTRKVFIFSDADPPKLRHKRRQLFCVYQQALTASALISKKTEEKSSKLLVRVSQRAVF